MFKKILRVLSLMLAALMLTAAFTSCRETGDGGTASGQNEETEPETTPETAPPARTEFPLVTGGNAVAKIVRNADLDISSQEVSAAKFIYKQILNNTGTDFEFGSDWIRVGDSFDTDSVEILVGKTRYPESRQVLADLPYGDFAVTAVGNKIVVAGHSDDAILKAANALADIIAVNGKSGELIIPAADLNRTGTVNKLVNEIPTYAGGTGVDYYATGNDSDEVIIRGTDMAEYNAYLDKLTASGYTLYSTKELTGNKFAILQASDYVINAGFYAYENSTRIIVEPAAGATLPAPESANVFTPVTTSQISMIGLEYLDSSNAYVKYGMCFLIRLADGRFIVIDGGYNRQQHADQIVAQIKKQAAGYAAPNDGYTIAAWIVTHAHDDHMGLFSGKYTAFGQNNITIENIIVNFMSDSEREKAISSAQFGGNWSSSEGGGYTNVLNAAKALKANLIVAHPGHDYYFADLHMEVLFTIDSYGPEVANVLNTTSLVIKMTFTDPKTGKQTVYMSTGDATGAGFGICAAMYGDYLKSDIVQVAHHGGTTWGNSDRTIAAYLLMAPSTLLWPRGLESIASSLKSSYNTPLFDSRNPNWRETYVAGREGTVITLPIPYTVGGANTAPYSKK